MATQKWYQHAGLKVGDRVAHVDPPQPTGTVVVGEQHDVAVVRFDAGWSAALDVRTLLKLTK